MIPCLAKCFTSQIYPVQNRIQAVTSITAVNEKYTVCSDNDNNFDNFSLPDVEDTRRTVNLGLENIYGPTKVRQNTPSPTNLSIRKDFSRIQTEKRIFHVKPASESHCIKEETENKTQVEETYI